jgi:hypothetical protein
LVSLGDMTQGKAIIFVLCHTGKPMQEQLL